MSLFIKLLELYDMMVSYGNALCTAILDDLPCRMAEERELYKSVHAIVLPMARQHHAMEHQVPTHPISLLHILGLAESAVCCIQVYVALGESIL